MKRIVLLLYIVLNVSLISAQSYRKISGRVQSKNEPVAGATVTLMGRNAGTVTDSIGQFSFSALLPGEYTLKVTGIGYAGTLKKINTENDLTEEVLITIDALSQDMSEVVVTGTMREIRRMESIVPVEVITPKLFQKNPVPSLFEAIGMINGVQPQLNCNVCNTGDIHINGMEGPYTMVLIDGMPIVSGLSTVYGLNGIPNSIVEKIEVVKGPASSLYGSEAMGGIINVITKNPKKAPSVSTDFFVTSWQEYNADASAKLNIGKASTILGINYFNYQHSADKNHDGFTDVTLQKRISLFNKWTFDRKDNRVASIAARYVNEDRWGGEMRWEKQWRGSDSIYGESIYTSRIEFIGMYQLPLKEKIMTQFSYNLHHQNSWYGITPYMADQQVIFIQSYWDKQIGSNHNLMLGASYRLTQYDDNSPATASADGLHNQSSAIPLPGGFVQDEWKIDNKHSLLTGYRYDYDIHHGSVHSPRLAYKWMPVTGNIFRASLGTGYRVVNLFTEDHAALSGAREVIIKESLNPERSYNGTINYVSKIPLRNAFLGIDITGFYSWFTNKIVGDFDTDPQKIIYDNLQGHAVSKGISLNTDATFSFPLKILAGITWMKVYQTMGKNDNDRMRITQLNAPEWSGNFVINYKFPKGYSVDFTGKWTGPMRLPVLPNDYRPEYSPWFCIANIQLTKKFGNGIELYGGVKNLFNFVPADPIMRPFDPFNKFINDPVNNPNGYTFDPSYNYAPLQGIRGFVGFRFQLSDQ